MYTKIKHLPSSAQYLYSVDDFSGSVNKLYRAKSKKRLYLVMRDCILSFTPEQVRLLSNKILDVYDSIPKEEIEDQTV